MMSAEEESAEKDLVKGTPVSASGEKQLGQILEEDAREL